MIQLRILKHIILQGFFKIADSLDSLLFAGKEFHNMAAM